MYRDFVDQATRNDIAAAAAAHNELGRDYDGAIAESLIDRIGAEIDKRMDTRLAQRSAPLVNQSSPHWMPVVIALGSMAMALAASAIILKGANSDGGPGGHADMVVVVIWIVIAGINVAYATAYANRR
jgi:hypothetical protein